MPTLPLGSTNRKAPMLVTGPNCWWRISSLVGLRVVTSPNNPVIGPADQAGPSCVSWLVSFSLGWVFRYHDAMNENDKVSDSWEEEDRAAFQVGGVDRELSPEQQLEQLAT